MQSQNSVNEASQHAVDYWQVIKNRYGVILMTLVLIFMTAAVITYIMPKKFESTAQVQVKPAAPDLLVFGAKYGQTSSSGLSPNYMETEFAVIESQQNLERVAKEMDLQAKWSLNEDETYNTLKSIIKTDEVRNTSLINIRVRYTNNIDARDIAAKVAECYKSRRLEIDSSRAKEALAQLERSVQEQSDTVEELRKKRDALMVRAKVLPDDRTTGERGIGDSNNSYLSLQQLVEKTKNDITEIDSAISSYANMNSDELIRAVANSQIADSGIKTLYAEYQETLRSFESTKQAGLGPNHPLMKGQEGQKEKLKSQLQESSLIFRENLKIRRQESVKQLNEQEARLSEMKKTVVESRAEMVGITSAQKDFETSQSMLDEMRTQLLAESINQKAPKSVIQIHEKPRVASYPVSPNVPMNLILGAIVGLIFGVGIAFFLEYLDTSVKSLEDVERYLQVPVLAVIPKDVGILHKQSGMSPDAEAYRILRTNIEFNRKNPEDNSLTVVSGGAGEGKSTTLINLAYICAQGGYTTLMIDADLRRPRLHTFFDINNSVGLTNYLTTELMLEDVILQTPVDNLYFMPSGILPADAAGILNSRRMSELIQDVKQRFDLVLVDSPPILGVSDASVLASEVDLTMIVVQHRKLPRNMLVRVKQSVENVGGHVIGVVLNNVDVRSDSQYQYYTSYYTYYAPTESQVTPQSSSPARQPSVSTTTNNNDQLY
jgi:polysaccharide biosynthesis transport protein